VSTRSTRTGVAVLIAATFLLVGETARAYRTGRDLPELAGSRRVRFAADEIRFQLLDDTPAGMNPLDVASAVESASGAWMAASCTALRFVFDGTTRIEAQPGDGVNTIQWVPNWNERGFDPQAAGATDMQYLKDGGSWVIAEADVYLNGEFKWTASGERTPGLRDVRAVVTHELGHVLGLLHPCEPGGAAGAPDCATSPDDANACMYPIYSFGQSQLSTDDVEGLCFLYPGPRCTAASCPEELLPMGATCRSGDACRDGFCLAAAGEESVCTRACGESLPKCPSFWSCEPASGQRVCAPQALEVSGGGCAMSRASSRRGSPLIFIAFLFISGRWFRSRSKEKQP